MKKFMVIASLFGYFLSANAADSHHWGYSGKYAPEHWGDISSDFHICKNGKYQSPIDITDVLEATTNAPLAFTYATKPNTITNNGHTIQVNFKQGSVLRFEKKDYALVQMHFHTPSEYTFSGKHAPMEAHIVHSTKNGELLVVSVMFDEGEENALIKQIWENAPKNTGENKAIKQLDVTPLLKDMTSYVRLDGSLTTPPCSEGVVWILSKSRQQASKDQIAFFTDIIGKNNRPTQPTNGRVIVQVK